MPTSFKVSMLCVTQLHQLLLTFTCMYIYLYVHRNIGLESALVKDAALARPSAPIKEDPKKKKSLTSYPPTPPRRSETHLIRKVTANGDNSVRDST